MKLDYKKNRIKIFYCVSAFLMLCTCSSFKGSEIIIEVKNNTNLLLTDAVVELYQPEFLEKLNKQLGIKLQAFNDKEELVIQVETNTDSTIIEKIIILSNFNPGQSKSISIRRNSGAGKSFVKRTQAELSVKEGGEWKQVTKENGTVQYEYIGGSFKNIGMLRVPDYHTDHSFYIRYEGPGWESDKIAYRFYLDWRNASDIFGKKTSDMVLQNVGQDGFDSYHLECDWGMDVLKVGNSLGIGSFGFWDGTKANRVAVTDSIFAEISENGIVQSKITTHYFGWKEADKSIDLTSEISINAGSRLTHQRLALSKNIENICTGIVKLDSGELIMSPESNNEWAYIATFGNQSLNKDNLGMCLFYKNSYLIELTGDIHSHVVVLRPQDQQLEYYFGAVWEKEIDAIPTKEAFISYLENTAILLSNPITINYK